jgi:hypothetical protein
MAWGCNQWF